MLKTIFTALFISLLSSCSAQSVNSTAVEELDLSRYLGKWHEVARFDTSFERDLVKVTAHYSLNPDGSINVVNRGYNIRTEKWGESKATAKATDDPGRFRVSFFPLVSSDYNILSVSEDYQWALVGSSSPNFLWILSRTEELHPDTLDHIISLAQSRGYDTSKLLIL
ncbi:MAG: lipocalin family protein [Rikenellaceae bacterium]